jgi:acyl-CoA thioesterase FadM
MPRIVTFQMPFDTGMFTPVQLQPRGLLSLAMSGWARWIHEHLGVSFPGLLAEHHTSTVVAGIQLEYLEPLRFLDGDLLQATAAVRAHRAGSTMDLVLDYSARARPVARVRLVLVPVHVEDVESLSAVPQRLPDELLGRFDADELAVDPARRRMREQLHAVEQQEPACEKRTPFTIHRHACEVADQWSYIELPGLVEPGREAISLDPPPKLDELRAGVSQPLIRFDAELRRPFFVFDSGILVTKAYVGPSRIAYVHELWSAQRGNRPNAIVIEQFEAAA